MKKYFLIIITLFISVLSFGQNSEPETKSDNQKQSKIRLTPFFSYDINLSSDIETDDLDVYLFNYDNFNYKIGIDIEYKFNTHISISSGINYSQKDFSFNSNCLGCEPLLYDTQTNLRFIELPLVGIYTYQVNDFELFAQLGVINQVDVNFDYFDENVPPDNINRYNFSGKIGVGVSYPLIKKHRLFIATDYTSSITSLFKNLDYKIKTLGIRMGIQFLL